MKAGIRRGEASMANFGKINHNKKYAHSNYGKAMIETREEKARTYYLPLIAWRFKNILKQKIEEAKNAMP